MPEANSQSKRNYPPTFHLPRSVTGREPQHLLMTLLGDYWRGRTETIPASVLVDLLAEFDITEASARQAMRRLRNRGLLAHEKIGRQSYYGSPEYVTAESQERKRRVLRFGLDFTDWDGSWTVVSFSVPEKERETRRHLRHELTELKFGMLHDAVWISPRRRVEQAIDLLDKYEVSDANVMQSKILERPGYQRSFSEVFGIEEMSEQYREFIARFEPMIERVREGKLSLSDALVLRTEVMTTWLQFRHIDPNLPVEVLPAGWPRIRAREVNYAIYDGLGTAAEARFKQIVARADPELAKLTSHYVSTQP